MITRAIPKFCFIFLIKGSFRVIPLEALRIIAKITSHRQFYK